MTALVPACLWILAVVDGGFAGFRDAAGRDARIFKQAYYRRAIRRGLRHGLVTASASAALVGLVVGLSPSPSDRIEELTRCGQSVLAVLAAYAILVLLAMGVWAAGEADLRTLASVVILGPFTLIRPYVILAAAAAGAMSAKTALTGATVLIACFLQMAIGPWLGRAWKHGPPLVESGPP